MTKDQILKHLKEDPLWEPDEDAAEADWDLFEEVYEEFEAQDTDQDTNDDDEDEELDDFEEDEDMEPYYDDEE